MADEPNADKEEQQIAATVGTKYALLLMLFKHYGIGLVACAFCWIVYQDFKETSTERAHSLEKQVEMSHKLTQDSIDASKKNTELLFKIKRLLEEKK